jgi:hypothetical protein
VNFTINGRPANETITYPARPEPRLSGSIPRPPVTPEEIPPRILSNLTAGLPFAHYGGQRPFARTDTGALFDPAGEVHALIRGVECGIPQFSFGGYSLSVVSAEQKAGCGTEGAEVQILIGTTLMAETPWTPGFHRLDLELDTSGSPPPRVATPGPPPGTPPSRVSPPDTGDGGLLR